MRTRICRMHPSWPSPIPRLPIQTLRWGSSTTLVKDSTASSRICRPHPILPVWLRTTTLTCPLSTLDWSRLIVMPRGNISPKGVPRRTRSARPATPASISTVDEVSERLLLALFFLAPQTPLYSLHSSTVSQRMIDVY